jgi:hypothetical protein
VLFIENSILVPPSLLPSAKYRPNISNNSSVTGINLFTVNGFTVSYPASISLLDNSIAGILEVFIFLSTFFSLGVYGIQKLHYKSL